MVASPYMHITLYQLTYKITSSNTIEFFDTDVFINSPHWQSSGILIFLCKYYIVISDTLVYSFLDALFLLLAVILSELHEKPRRKDWVTEKKYIEEFVWGISLFLLHALFSMSFCLFVAFFVYFLPLSKWCACGMTSTKIYILLWVVFCVMISWENGRK